MSKRYMAKSMTVRVTPEGKKNNVIGNFWDDILCGRIPLLKDEFGKVDCDICLVARKDNFSEDRDSYDYTVTATDESFINQLEEQVEAGNLRKYHYGGGSNTKECARAAWSLVSADFLRKYEYAYEITEPNDGNPYCDIYVSIKED